MVYLALGISPRSLALRFISAFPLRATHPWGVGRTSTVAPVEVPDYGDRRRTSLVSRWLHPFSEEALEVARSRKCPQLLEAAEQAPTQEDQGHHLPPRGLHKAGAQFLVATHVYLLEGIAPALQEALGPPAVGAMCSE